MLMKDKPVLGIPGIAMIPLLQFIKYRQFTKLLGDCSAKPVGIDVKQRQTSKESEFLRFNCYILFTVTELILVVQKLSLPDIHDLAVGEWTETTNTAVAA
ncbi:hypothetical protein L6452_15166 [Arctium lappa]|uniref:Uncharacterized protein n=1 Tax=Arctium lappa TaxID=4217 RepID=A0ACB9CN40_ARCLA|nr:hypothetical protein L6452_15166 [Arctium lappa]